MDNESEISEIVRARDEYRRLVKDKGRAAVLAVAGSLFAKFPRVNVIQWAQYTPYFNDGDPCEWRMGEIRLGEGQSEPMDKWDDSRSPNPIGKEAFACAGRLGDIEDCCEGAFGDHVEVTISRGIDGGALSVVVDEYEHD